MDIEKRKIIPEYISKNEEGAEASKEVVTIVTQISQLQLYEQAAAQTGSRIQVLAREGGEHSFWDYGTIYTAQGKSRSGDRRVLRTVTIGAGDVALAIEKAPEQKDHHLFWSTVYSLKSAAKEQKS